MSRSLGDDEPVSAQVLAAGMLDGVYRIAWGLRRQLEIFIQNRSREPLVPDAAFGRRWLRLFY